VQSVRVVGLDSALLSVGRASPFPTPLQPLSPAEAGAGLTAVLHNNIVSAGDCPTLFAAVIRY
jgi:hypothetical protein